MEIHFLKLTKPCGKIQNKFFGEGRGEGEGKGHGQRKVGKDDEEGEVRGTEGEMDRRGGGEVQAAAGPAIRRGTTASTTDGRRWPSQTVRQGLDRDDQDDRRLHRRLHHRTSGRHPRRRHRSRQRSR